MENICTSKPSEKIVMGNITMYLSEYILQRQRVYKEQPAIAGGFMLTDQGVKGYRLIVNGKIHKSQNNIPVILDTYIQTTNTFNFDISGVKYRNLKLVNYKMAETISNQYIECEIEFICTGSIEEVTK